MEQMELASIGSENENDTTTLQKCILESSHMFNQSSSDVEKSYIHSNI